MSVSPAKVGNSAQANTGRAQPKRRTLQEFWQRVSEGLAIEQLWSQFKAEATETYGFYSREVDWDAVRQGKRWVRPLKIAQALFWSMLLKLTPARRVLLLIALVLMIFSPQVEFGNRHANIQFVGLGSLILFVLLALELADRVVMKRDLEIAREIQRWLVPEAPPQIPGMDVAFATRPANTVAGDYYDVFRRSPDDSSRILLVIADVAGKSVPAALLMATFQASLRALAGGGGTLADIVSGLNRYACAHSLGGLRFTTAFFAEYHPVTRSLGYINAGHNAPILRHASPSVFERLEAGGLPLGILPETDYVLGQTRMAPGDLLLMFTDGLIEAVDDRGDEYGEERLLRQVNTMPAISAAATLQRLMDGVGSFAGQVRQHDDITCLVFRTV